jgi:hypothetical protein
VRGQAHRTIEDRGVTRANPRLPIRVVRAEYDGQDSETLRTSATVWNLVYAADTHASPMAVRLLPRHLYSSHDVCIARPVVLNHNHINFVLPLHTLAALDVFPRVSLAAVLVSSDGLGEQERPYPQPCYGTSYVARYARIGAIREQ